MNKIGVEVAWLKNSQPLSLAEEKYQAINRDFTYQLVISDVTKADRGEYTVQAGALQSTGILTVTGQCRNN